LDVSRECLVPTGVPPAFTKVLSHTVASSLTLSLRRQVRRVLGAPSAHNYPENLGVRYPVVNLTLRSVRKGFLEIKLSI
jgi:hypothetical protein